MLQNFNFAFKIPQNGSAHSPNKLIKNFQTAQNLGSGQLHATDWNNEEPFNMCWSNAKTDLHEVFKWWRRIQMVKNISLFMELRTSYDAQCSQHLFRHFSNTTYLQQMVHISRCSNRDWPVIENKSKICRQSPKP